MTGKIRYSVTLILLIITVSSCSLGHLSPEQFIYDPQVDELHFAALGDTGSGNQNQKDVSLSLSRVHRDRPFHLVLLAGDQFYPDGVSSIYDSQWEAKFETMYRNFSIPFFAVPGNHEYEGNVNAFIDRTNISDKWKAPSRFYTFTVPLKDGTTIQFFAIDTYALLKWYKRFDGQLQWLDRQLKASKADWKIVFGHHPLLSDGKHRSSSETEYINDTLAPLFKRSDVALYISGHDHNLQLHQSKSGFYQLISGGGGARIYDIAPLSEAEFSVAEQGFAAISVNNQEINIKFYSATDQILFDRNISRVEIDS